MEILREYVLENSRSPFFRCSSVNAPFSGEKVNIMGISYDIIEAKYDYEVWQSTGLFVYTCQVKQTMVNTTLLERIVNQLSAESPLFLDAVDIINNAYPGGDIGDYMSDKNNHYVSVNRITLSSKEDVELFMSETADNIKTESTFNLNCKSIDGITICLYKNFFKAKLYWSSSFITPIEVFERDGKVDVLLQVVVPKGSSKEFDNFIQTAISLT